MNDPRSPSPAPLDGQPVPELVLLLTDVVDSTQVLAHIGDEAAHRLWAAHDRATRLLMRAWNGRELARSDGFLVLFDRCEDALGFALGYHRALAALDVPLLARVGFHCGPSILRPNATADVAAGAPPFEIDGIALPTAARVMAAAMGRQTLLSDAAWRRLPAQALGGLKHCAHGHWRLKGLDEPVELYEVGPDDSPLMPPPDTAKAYRVVRRGDQWQSVAQLPNNLGGDSDNFVGRDSALRALAAAFDDGARLVTLVGTGGIGKTRLALRYARGWMGTHPGGVWFCDLSAARTMDGIALAVAQALDLPLGRTDPIQQLARALAARGPCLLVLDNFEQVARHAEASLGVWMRHLAEARFLVTSREVLGLPGERLQGLSPLATEEATRLFIDRMHAAGLDSDLPAADAATLPRLVEMLDCLPLAIELAASRARVMPPAEQLRRISERFRLLSSRGARHDRQATLRATLDWSWDLLQPAEQLALAQLSVFEGGFTLTAVEAVVDLGASEAAPWVTDVLQGLVEKSLVQRLHARRFALLRSVQDYAAEKLATLDPQAVARHWRHFSGLSEPQAIADRCVELDNLAAACRNASAAVDHDPALQEQVDACAVSALVNTWAALRLVGPFRACPELAQTLVARSDLAPRHDAWLHFVLAACLHRLGQGDEAVSHGLRGEELARQTGQTGLLARLLITQADFKTQQGRFDDARTATAQAQQLAATVGDPMLRLVVSNQAGNLALACSQWAEASRHFMQALELAQTLGDRRWEGGLHGSLGALALQQGHMQQARHHLQLATQMANEVGDRQWAGNAHSNLGLLLQQLGETQLARQNLDAALALSRAIGHRRLEATALCNLGLLLQQMRHDEEALEHFERSVLAAQTLAVPRLEGQLTGYLAEHLGRMRRHGESLQALARAEQLLLTIEDSPELLLFRCHQTTTLAAAGEVQAARDAWPRAQALALRQPAWRDEPELAAALQAAERSVAVGDDGIDRGAVDRR